MSHSRSETGGLVTIDVKQQVEAAKNAMYRATMAQDWDAVAPFYAEDAVVLPDRQPMICGGEAYLADLKSEAAAGLKILAMQSEITEVFTAADLIHEVGRYNITLQVPGVPEPINSTGKYVTIWRQDPNGSLQVRLDTWNRDA